MVNHAVIGVSVRIHACIIYVYVCSCVCIRARMRVNGCVANVI